MKKAIAILGGIVLLGLAAPGRGVAASQASTGTAAPQAAAPAPQQQTPQKAEAAAACADCHDQATIFARNPHARIPAPAGGKMATGDAVCAICHGNTKAHLDSGGEQPVERPLKGREGANFCLTCHTQATDHTSFRNGIHGNTATVNCTTCHNIHQADPKIPHLLARAPNLLCASCHTSQAASFANKPFAHRLRTGVMECVSCHNPHGLPGRDSLKLTMAGELPCISCHTEKRGPFVFEHVTAGEGDCLSCHEPHGSSNPKQLARSRVDQLCLECHSPISPGTLGPQPPSFHNLLSPRYQNCTTCHVAVHGSNLSPLFLK
jgi:DmsE family decaheme c-type cytochrome